MYAHLNVPGLRSCDGRITWEHALKYAGKQVQERFAIIPLCWYHHLGAGLNKRFNEYCALLRATASDFAKYPKANWPQLFEALQKAYETGLIFKKKL